MAEFNLFTDGTSNVLAYTSPIREEGVTDNTRFSISIDYFDVYDENGEKRDWSKLTYTILHEYGHVLLEDETQVDLTVGRNTHDPAGFVEGAFRRAFYDAFWRELGVSGAGDYDRSPTHYVSRYGANYFHEDIADTFAVFLEGPRYDGAAVRCPGKPGVGVAEASWHQQLQPRAAGGRYSGGIGTEADGSDCSGGAAARLSMCGTGRFGGAAHGC